MVRASCNNFSETSRPPVGPGLGFSKPVSTVDELLVAAEKFLARGRCLGRTACTVHGEDVSHLSAQAVRVDVVGAIYRVQASQDLTVAAIALLHRVIGQPITDWADDIDIHEGDIAHAFRRARRQLRREERAA